MGLSRWNGIPGRGVPALSVHPHIRVERGRSGAGAEHSPLRPDRKPARSVRGLESSAPARRLLTLCEGGRFETRPGCFKPSAAALGAKSTKNRRSARFGGQCGLGAGQMSACRWRGEGGETVRGMCGPVLKPMKPRPSIEAGTLTMSTRYFRSENLRPRNHQGVRKVQLSVLHCSGRQTLTGNKTGKTK